MPTPGEDNDRYELPNFDDRESYFDYLDRRSVETEKERLERHRALSPVKSYLLDIDSDVEDDSFIKLFARAGYVARRIDEALWVLSKSNQSIGLLERSAEQRGFVLFSLLPAADVDRMVQTLTQTVPDIDETWFAADVFHALWSRIQRYNSPQRYVKISFEYTAAYEGDRDLTEDLELNQSEHEDQSIDVEDLRASRFALSDKIFRIAAALPNFEKYDPLQSIVQLRLPGSVRGGHDLYYRGKLTNRSNSFQDHRATALAMVSTYASMTAAISKFASIRIEQETTSVFGPRLTGAPVRFEFAQPLSQYAFDRWLDALKRTNNRFRINGIFRRLSATKAHLIGIDRHMWQPINLELTTKHVVGLLPGGSCANIINRTITNVQRFVDPGVKVTIGSRSYREFADVFGGPSKAT